MNTDKNRFAWLGNVAVLMMAIAFFVISCSGYMFGDDYWMKPLQINTIADLLVNDEIVAIPNNVILAGSGPHASYAPLYNVYSEFTFENVPLNAGLNNITLQFKKSTIGEKNHWNETPSTMNIDYIDLITEGHSIDKSAKVKQIGFQDDFVINYGDNFDTMIIPIYATYNNGENAILESDEVTIIKPNGYATIGTHNVVAILKSDASITATKSFTIGDIILQAENAVKSGSTKVVDSTESEYSPVDQSSINTATVVKGMDNSATNYSGETSLSFTFNAAQGLHGLVVRCDNAYYFENPYRTLDVNLEKCVDIEVNGVSVSFTTPIPSIASTTNADVCWMTLYELNIGNITLLNGSNTIKIIAKKDAPKNKWSECSIPRFDYIKLTAPIN